MDMDAARCSEVDAASVLRVGILVPHFAPVVFFVLLFVLSLSLDILPQRHIPL